MPDYLGPRRPYYDPWGRPIRQSRPSGPQRIPVPHQADSAETPGSLEAAVRARLAELENALSVEQRRVAQYEKALVGERRQTAELEAALAAERRRAAPNP